MLLTFKQKIELNKLEQEIIEQTSNEARILYNNLLEQKLNTYKESGKCVNYYTLQKSLKNWECSYLTYDMKKEVCRLLDNNFKSFYELNKNNKNLMPHPPKFRGKKYFFTLSFTQDFIIEKDILKLSNKKCKYLKIKINHGFQDESIKIRNKTNSILKTCKLVRQDGNYFICITYKSPERMEIQTNKPLSIDLGKKNLISYYDNETNTACVFNSEKFYRNQKYFDKRIDGIKSKRDLKRNGSRKWRKLNQTKRKLELKKRQQTLLSLHKLSKNLSKLDRDIIIGELTNLKQNVISMYKRMNRQMLNNWQLQTFTNLLEYKCRKEGRKLVKVNEAWTSKTCCRCGEIKQKLTPSNRTYHCEHCGQIIDRDVNGAINILKVYKQKMGDYSTPIWESLISQERFFGNFRKINHFHINM